MCQNKGILYIFTCKCASRYSGAQFFDIRTSKSAPNPTCFVHFHLQMCFALQRRAFDMRTSKSAPTMRCFVHFHLQMCFVLKRRAIFRHENFKKCSNHEVFCTFSLAKCAFRHSGVQFWISPQNTHLRTRRFNRPTFRLTRHTNH